jgi:hypothetical protein
MAETDDKDWLVEISHPIFPLGLRITRIASTDEVRDLLNLIKEKLPEWRVETIGLNKALRELDKVSQELK